jgi:hypothetical protein
MNININPMLVYKGLLSVICLLVIANSLGIISKYFLDHEHVFGLIRLFDLNKEANIPTLFASCLHLFASILLLIIVLMHKKNNTVSLYWAGLVIVFMFLGLDEISGIHEMLITPVRSSMNATGYLYFAWVIPYGIFTLILFLLYIRFLIDLPRKILCLFILSGFMFISGAIGFELLGGKHYELSGYDLEYALYVTCEETLEMLGVATFIYALMTYIVDTFTSVSIVIIKGNNAKNKLL